MIDEKHQANLLNLFSFLLSTKLPPFPVNVGFFGVETMQELIGNQRESMVTTQRQYTSLLWPIKLGMIPNDEARLCMDSQQVKAKLWIVAAKYRCDSISLFRLKMSGEALVFW